MERETKYDMPIVQAPASTEYNFQYIPDENDERKMSSVSFMLSDIKCGSIVSVKGKITKGTKPEVVGKKWLTMLGCAISDETGSASITFWEDEIDKIKDGAVYSISNASVRSGNNSKTLSTTPTSIIEEEHDDTLAEIDASDAVSELLAGSQDSIIQVRHIRSVNIDKYKSCVECSAKFSPGLQTKIVKCLRCGHRMRFEECQVIVTCHMSVPAECSTTGAVTLTAFSDVVSNLLSEADIGLLTEDQIAGKTPRTGQFKNLVQQ